MREWKEMMMGERGRKEEEDEQEEIWLFREREKKKEREMKIFAELCKCGRERERKRTSLVGPSIRLPTLLSPVLFLLLPLPSSLSLPCSLRSLSPLLSSGTSLRSMPRAWDDCHKRGSDFLGLLHLQLSQQLAAVLFTTSINSLKLWLNEYSFATLKKGFT